MEAMDHVERKGDDATRDESKRKLGKGGAESPRQTPNGQGSSSAHTGGTSVDEHKHSAPVEVKLGGLSPLDERKGDRGAQRSTSPQTLELPHSALSSSSSSSSSTSSSVSSTLLLCSSNSSPLPAPPPPADAAASSSAAGDGGGGGGQSAAAGAAAAAGATAAVELDEGVLNGVGQYVGVLQENSRLLGVGTLLSVNQETGMGSVRLRWGTVYCQLQRLVTRVQVTVSSFAKVLPRSRQPDKPLRLRPLRFQLNLRHKVETLLDSIMSLYRNYELAREDVVLVCNGQQVRPSLYKTLVAESGWSFPLHVLVVVQCKQSTFGGWRLVAPNMRVEESGLVARNTGSNDKWRAIRTHECAGESRKGKHTVQIKVEKNTPTGNSWRMCIGVVPPSFSETIERCWVGSMLNSWSYVAGTGGLCHNSGQSTVYGAPYGEGDVIRISMDFDRGELEFFKNNVSQGIATTKLVGPVYPAVSLTAANAAVRLLE